MTVRINRTDGTELVSIQDGAINTDQSNLTLIGRLYRNYGELINENFVKLLENFANSSAPTVPLVGQLWYNTSTGSMSMYRSTGFISLAILTTSSAQPNLPAQGDLWFDTFDEQLKMYTGSTWLAVSPQYTATQNKTGVFVETRRDVLNNNHVCLVTYQSNSVTAIHCRDAEWSPQVGISGFVTVKPGLNLANVNSQKFVGSATNADALGGVDAASFLRNDIDGTLDGSLTINSNTGLMIGQFADFQLSLDGNQSYITRGDGAINFNIGIDTIARINETNQIQAIDGAETAPSYSFITDVNSGMYKVDDGIIGVSIAGTKILEISAGGLYVVGDIQASNYSGTLNADIITATSITTDNITVLDTTTTEQLQVNADTIIGSSVLNTLQINAGSVSIPHGLIFSLADVTFTGVVNFDNSLTTLSGADPLTIDADLYVTGDSQLVGGLTVLGLFSANSYLIVDAGGRVTLNSSIQAGYSGIGDFSMGATNGIRSYNSPKMWIAFNGTLAGLAIADSFHIDFVTRTSANNYSFTTEFPITSGAMAVVGSNGASLASTPSIGATSFSITTSSESARMGLVVLSQ